MSSQTIGSLVLAQPPLLRTIDTVGAAVRRLLECELPALPVVDADGRYAGIFGEREFMTALYPAYLGELRQAGFLPRSLDDALEKRSSCRDDSVEAYMNREHVDVPPDFADTHVAELFLHHRILIVPVVEDGRPVGLIRRSDFFRTTAARFLDPAAG